MATSPVIVTSQEEIQKMVTDALNEFTDNVVVPLLNKQSRGSSDLQIYKNVIDGGRYGSRSFLDKLRRNMSVEDEQRIFPKIGGMVFVVVPDLEDYLAGRKLRHDALIKLDPRSRGEA